MDGYNHIIYKVLSHIIISIPSYPYPISPYPITYDLRCEGREEIVWLECEVDREGGRVREEEDRYLQVGDRGGVRDVP